MSGASFLNLAVGSRIVAGGRAYRVTHHLGLDSVLGEDIETGAAERLHVAQIKIEDPKAPEAGNVAAKGRDLESISDEDWRQAQRRFEIIKPLLENPFRTRADAVAAAVIGDVHVTTIYEWMHAYQTSGHISALIPRQRGRRKGTKLLPPAVEEIISSTINESYLHPQKRRPQQIVDEVQLLCRNAKLPAPHPNSIRKRIQQIAPATVLRRRGRRDQARNLYEPIRGEFPGATFPLATIQIDHTKADIIVVEERTRLPMGRPVITLALDIYSRMVFGVYVSMDEPSSTAAGLCLARGILPKNEYLASLEVPGIWPVWGRPRIVHCDNAREFRGAMLTRACEQYGIGLDLRPVKRPHYGGHIERLMGTSANEIRKLPGATFSSPKERKGYDSERQAALTLGEFEQYLADFIVNVYHKRLHSELGVPPIRQWEIGVVGEKGQPGAGLPEVPGDPARIALDFMPFVERTVQPYGLVIDDIHYYHEVLNRWINATDPEDSRKKRQFIVRRDPRDISRVFFFDPEAQQYFTIPYRNTAHPPISVWELRQAQERVREEGREQVDEDALFDAVMRLRSRVESALTKTKAARRHQHRIGVSQRIGVQKPEVVAAGLVAPVNPMAPASAGSVPVRPHPSTSALDDIFAEPVEPFDDIGPMK